MTESPLVTSSPVPDDAQGTLDPRPLDPRIDALLILAAIVCSISTYACLALLIHAYYAPPHPDYFRLLPRLRAQIAPEPEERGLYLIGLGAIAVFPISFYGVFLRAHRASPGLLTRVASSRWLLLKDVLLIAGVGLWIAILARRREGAQYDAPLAWAAGLLPLIALAPLSRIRLRASLGHLFAIVLILAASRVLILDDGLMPIASRSLAGHFDVVIGAINQARHGRTVTVDLSSNYGVLYPHIADWALSWGELSAFRISAFFAVLAAISCLFVYLAFCEQAGYRSAAPAVMLLAVLGLCHPAWQGGFWGGLPQGSYFQYYPLRVVCGAFFLWFVAVYFRRPSRRLLAFGYAAAAASVLWNADTGLVLLIAWTTTQVFALLGRRPWRTPVFARGVICHVAFAALSLSCALAAFTLFVKARSGHYPDYAGMMMCQRIFYLCGFGMLPMRIWEFWQPIILVYLTVVFYCLRQALAGKMRAVVPWYFFIALYGLGIFSYYQGRSHYLNLLHVLYPAVILSCLMSYDLLQQLKTSVKTPEEHDSPATQLATAATAGALPATVFSTVAKVFSTVAKGFSTEATVFSLGAKVFSLGAKVFSLGAKVFSTEAVKSTSAALVRMIGTPTVRYQLICLLMVSLLPLTGLAACCRGFSGVLRSAAKPLHPWRARAPLDMLLAQMRTEVEGRPAVFFSPLGNYCHLRTKSYSATPFSALDDIFLEHQLLQLEATLDRPDVQHFGVEQVDSFLGDWQARTDEKIVLVNECPSLSHFRKARNEATSEPATQP